MWEYLFKLITSGPHTVDLLFFSSHNFTKSRKIWQETERLLPVVTDRLINRKERRRETKAVSTQHHKKQLFPAKSCKTPGAAACNHMVPGMAERQMRYRAQFAINN